MWDCGCTTYTVAGVHKATHRGRSWWPCFQFLLDYVIVLQWQRLLRDHHETGLEQPADGRVEEFAQQPILSMRFLGNHRDNGREGCKLQLLFLGHTEE